MKTMRISNPLFSQKIMFLFTVFALLTGCSSSTSIPSSTMESTLQPFVVDNNIGDQGPILRILTKDKKEKLEISDGKFSDGTNILVSIVYQRNLGDWKQIALGQEPYKQNDPVRVTGYDQFGILEIINPNIIKVEYETKYGKFDLAISQVKNRRFVAYKQNPGAKDYYQIYGFDKKGQVLWQLYPEGYW